MAKQLTSPTARKYRGLAKGEFNDEAKVIRQLRQDITDLLPYKDKLVSYLKKQYSELDDDMMAEGAIREGLHDELKGILTIIGKIAATTNVLVRSQYGISAIDAAIELTKIPGEAGPARLAGRPEDDELIIVEDENDEEQP
jgi:hypothetical protein